MSDEATERRERARMVVEDAVYQMLEAGFSAEEIKAEVDYAIESAES